MIAELQGGSRCPDAAARYRWCLPTRAYEDKQGGWTLVAECVEVLSLRSRAGILIW